MLSDILIKIFFLIALIVYTWIFINIIKFIFKFFRCANKKMDNYLNDNKRGK